MSLQFDILPVNVRMFEQEKSHKGQLECHLEAYFEDQMRRQAKKAQRILRDKGIVKQTSRRKKRTEYNKLYKKKQRQDSAFKANEIVKERAYIQNKREDPAFKANEIINMQNKRKDPGFKANEIISKRTYMQNKRKDPAFKAEEIVNERAYIQNKR